MSDLRMSVTKISLKSRVWRSQPARPSDSETAGSGLCLLPSLESSSPPFLGLPSKVQGDSGHTETSLGTPLWRPIEAMKVWAITLDVSALNTVDFETVRGHWHVYLLAFGLC